MRLQCPYTKLVYSISGSSDYSKYTLPLPHPALSFTLAQTTTLLESRELDALSAETLQLIVVGLALKAGAKLDAPFAPDYAWLLVNTEQVAEGLLLKIANITNPRLPDFRYTANSSPDDLIGYVRAVGEARYKYKVDSAKSERLVEALTIKLQKSQFREAGFKWTPQVFKSLWAVLGVSLTNPNLETWETCITVADSLDSVYWPKSVHCLDFMDLIDLLESSPLVSPVKSLALKQLRAALTVGSQIGKIVCDPLDLEVYGDRAIVKAHAIKIVEAKAVAEAHKGVSRPQRVNYQTTTEYFRALAAYSKGVVATNALANNSISGKTPNV